MKMLSPKMEEVEEEEVVRRKKWPCMKSEQLLEFQMQIMVYRYIEAGLRVPHHLVVPIWNSLVLSSSSSSSNYLIHHNPHSSSLLSCKEEPVPIRCGRTDGKKWRCSNEVIPSQKYCERHMHRGRNRSRKLVESSTYEVASSSASSTKHDNTCGLDNNNESESVPQETMSVSSNASSQVVTIASLPSTRPFDTVTRPSFVITEPINKNASLADKRRRTMKMSYDDFIKQRESSTCVQVVPVQGDESLPSVQKLFPEVSDVSLEAAKASSNRKNDIIARSREWKDIYVNLGMFTCISPDTVLEDRSGFIHRYETDDEPGRCRRTDGKKWRCRRDVLSGQKYCDNHMHRGSIKRKKYIGDTKPNENFGFNSFIVKTAAKSVSCKDGDGKKLSVTVMGVPLSRVSDQKSTSSCSTDTTITDTALRGEEEDNEEYLSLCSSGV